jgi:hypothetical protein
MTGFHTINTLHTIQTYIHTHTYIHIHTYTLPSVRGFIPKEDAPAMVLEATLLLKDTRYPPCLEGLLLLINCLPTDYDGYASVLPACVCVCMYVCVCDITMI